MTSASGNGEQACINDSVFIAVVQSPHIPPPFDDLKSWAADLYKRLHGMKKDAIADMLAEGQVRFKTAVKIVVRQVIPKEFILSGQELAYIGNSFIHDKTNAALYAKMGGVKVPKLTLADAFYAMLYMFSVEGELGWNMDAVLGWTRQSLGPLLKMAYQQTREVTAPLARKDLTHLPAGHADLKYFFDEQKASQSQSQAMLSVGGPKASQPSAVPES